MSQLFQSVPAAEPAAPPLVALTAGRQLHSPASHRRRDSILHPVLDEDLFSDVLMRELRRADRFEESFALMFVTFTLPDAAAPWRETIDALIPSLLETDVIGWFKQHAVLSVIRPLAQLEPAEAASALAATVRRELGRGLRAKSAACCSIRVGVYSASSDGAAEALTGNIRRHAIDDAARNASKRALDVAAGMALLGVLSPVFLVVSALIKLTSKGPVLFRQTRIGRDGRPFTMLKFRTMQENCDSAIHQHYVTQFIQSGAPAGGVDGTVFKIVDDPRITRVGHFLRRSSLDELPQFWNVVRGEMSLVGPRPPLPYEVERYKRWHRRRLYEAKPGITGLWQVTGRSRTTFDEMVRLDLRYAKTCSVWNDLKILLATPRAVVTGKGAH